MDDAEVAPPTERPHDPKVTSKTLSKQVYICARCSKQGGTLKRLQEFQETVYVCFPGCGTPHERKIKARKER